MPLIVGSKSESWPFACDMGDCDCVFHDAIEPGNVENDSLWRLDRVPEIFF